MSSDQDDYSDLTELSSDEDYGGSSSQAKKKKRASSPTGWKIRKALKVPRATTYTAQALYDQMYSDDIDLDPEYQRAVVWPDSKMIGLIDSILRNFYVPPIIFSVIHHDDGSEKRICIDGKQRLTSIQRFMDGLIFHKDPITNQKLWYTDTGSGGGNAKKKLLPLKYRKVFANKQIVCVEYADLSDNDEREIFQRVQLGMALTPAEKLQVTNTPRSAFVRSLVSHFVSSVPSPDSIGGDGAGTLSKLDWDRTRGADYRALAQLVYCLHTFPAFPVSGQTLDLSKAKNLKTLGSVASLDKFLSDEGPFTDDFQAQVRATLRVFGALASDREVIGKGKDRLEVRQVFKIPTKIAPVELVLLGLFVGVHMSAAGCTATVNGGKKESKLERGEREAREAAGRKTLAEGIRMMRKDVRDVHVDIRMNSRVGKTMIDFIKSWRSGPSASTSGVASSSSSSAGKRKRAPGETDKAVEDGEVSMDEEGQNRRPDGKRKRAAGEAVEDGEVSMDDEGQKRRSDGEVNDDEVPLRLKFKKVPGQASSAKPPSLSGAKAAVAPLPRPDRMAAVRAAKLQINDGGGQSQPLPAPSPRSPSTRAPESSHGNGILASAIGGTNRLNGSGWGSSQARGRG